MNITRPALRYFGGKWQIGKWIISHFPKHTAYVEPFGGGASVLLRKPPTKIEVYNDLNGMAVNFFQVLRGRPEELIRALELTPYARAEYIQSQQPTDDPLENARRFYVGCWQGRGRGGVVESGGWRFMKKDNHGQTPCDDWRNISHLYAVAERLRHVQIESIDAFRCIDTYDTPETLFYLDPPYLPDTRSLRWGGSSYLHEYGAEDHGRLAEKLHTIKGMAIVSGYPSAAYDDLYPGWRTADKSSRKDSATPERVATTERLWISPRCHTKQMEFYAP